MEWNKLHTIVFSPIVPCVLDKHEEALKHWNQWKDIESSVKDVRIIIHLMFLV